MQAGQDAKKPSWNIDEYQLKFN